MSEQLFFSFGEKLALLSPDDIYQQAEELISLLKEDRRLERKPPGIHCRLLGEYFSMWANTSPDGGIIVIGMEDGGKFSGCLRLSSDKLNDVEKSPRKYCPDAKVESKRVPVIDETGHENFVVVFRVYYRSIDLTV